MSWASGPGALARSQLLAESGWHNGCNTYRYELSVDRRGRERGKNMISRLLDTVYEYQLLRAKERMDIELGVEEKVRTRVLRQCLRGNFINGRKRHCNRFDEPPTVYFTVAGGFGEGRLHDICGSGVAIASSANIAMGTRTVLRMRDEEQSAEYVFPARVVWRSKGIIGLGFDGAPSRTDLAQWAWQNLRMTPRRAAMVA